EAGQPRVAAAGLVKAVQLVTLVIHRRFRRVQVLGLLVGQHPPAKADDPAAAVSDREDDAVAEAVILALALRTVGPRRAVFALDHQPGLDHVADRLGTGADSLQQVVPARWGKTDAECLGDLAGQATLLKVVDGARLVGVAAQL